MFYLLNGFTDQTIIYSWAGLIRLGINGHLPAWVSGNLTYANLFGFSESPLSTNQPVTWALIRFIIITFKSPHVMTAFALVSALCVLLVCYGLFRKYRYSLIYAVIFSASEFFWIHFGIHQELMQVWVFPAFIWIVSSLLFVDSFRSRRGVTSYFFNGVFFILVSLISNYFGFMLYLTSAFLVFSYLITHFAGDRGEAITQVIKYFTSIIVSAILLFLILFPYIDASYNASDIRLVQTANRPYEDFFTFSLRPWYFLTPSPKNPIYADFSKSITEKIASTGYFLADDYFPAEHSGAFYGYLLLATFFVLLYFGLFKSSKELRPKIWTLFLTIVMVLSVTMPPFFTIAGVEIYTPGWLVYKFFPMFRVTARFTVVILLLMLMIMAEVITENYEKWKKFLRYFMPVLLIVTLAETFVPFKIEKYDVAPAAYNYMSSQVPMSMNFVVYPYDESNEALFWLPTHKQCLMNVRDNNYPDISSADLTKKIYLSEGLEKAKEYSIEYVLVFGGDSNYAKFNNPSFVLNEDFGDSRLYKIQ